MSDFILTLEFEETVCSSGRWQEAAPRHAISPRCALTRVRLSFILSSFSTDRSYKSKQPDDGEACRAEVIRLGGNPSDRTDLLGQFAVQFGRFNGKTFSDAWLLEGLGYSAWFVNSMSCETNMNKHSFKEYLESLPKEKRLWTWRQLRKLQSKNLPLRQKFRVVRLDRWSTRSTTVDSLFGRSPLSPQAIAKRLQQNIYNPREKYREAREHEEKLGHGKLRVIDGESRVSGADLSARGSTRTQRRERGAHARWSRLACLKFC